MSSGCGVVDIDRRKVENTRSQSLSPDPERTLVGVDVKYV
jgi:hypothetical protein